MSLRTVCVTIALCGAASSASAQPYYVVAAGGQQFQQGAGLPFPIQPATTGGTMMAPIGTQTMFPPLLIPVIKNPAKAFVKMPFGPNPRQITIPPGLFRRPAPGPVVQGVARYNKKLFQIRTNLDFSGPAPTLGSAVLEAGGRTGAPVTTLTGVPASSQIRYATTAAQFGGPLQTQIAPVSPGKHWANPGAKLPCKHPAFGGADFSCLAVILLTRPGPLAAAGGPVGFTATTPGGPVPPRSQWRVHLSVPNTTGLVAASVNVGGATHVVTNMATSAGFPWTTGMITLSQPTAAGTPEVFTITGMDSRVNGLGHIALVSGALSDRAQSGPNSNRGWMRMTLPEPGAVTGVVTALAALALTHRLARRSAPR